MVMLTEFYKLWLTPLPTADWILNKQSQVAEFSSGWRSTISPALGLPHGAPTSACLILGSCSGERQPMGWVDAEYLA